MSDFWKIEQSISIVILSDMSQRLGRQFKLWLIKIEYKQ